MKTSKSLRELVPDIRQHILMHQSYLQYNNRLLLVHEGQLRPEIEASLKAELSETAYLRAIKRVPSINILVRLIDKLSRVYVDPAMRTPNNSGDEDLLRYYEKALDFTNVMPSANRMVNLHKACALEPYLCDEGPALRVLPASRFLVFSDSLNDPLEPTVFIKLMPRELKTVYTTVNGEKVNTQEPYFVDMYYLYSDDEIIILDSDGEIRTDRMLERGMDGTNPIGQIPFVYINKSDFRLIPLPDTDTLDNTILIPKLLADLNYAVQFQSHSLTIARDLELPANLPTNPDVVWSLKTDEGAKQQGQIQTIKPEVDIEKVLLLIETTLALWLEARNIKTTSVVGKVTAESASSGVAKIIDEADATQDRRSQMSLFQKAEEELWELIVLMHEYWSSQNLIEERTLFRDGFTVGVKFSNVQPMQTEQDELTIVKSQLEAGLISKKGAMQRLNPHMAPPEIAALMKETGEAQLTLDGRQLTAIVDLITAVTAGQIPRDSAKGILVKAFPILEADAELMLGSAGMDNNGQPSQPDGSSNVPPANVSPIQPTEGGSPGSGNAP